MQDRRIYLHAEYTGERNTLYAMSETPTSINPPAIGNAVVTSPILCINPQTMKPVAMSVLFLFYLRLFNLQT